MVPDVCLMLFVSHVRNLMWGYFLLFMPLPFPKLYQLWKCTYTQHTTIASAVDHSKSATCPFLRAFVLWFLHHVQVKVKKGGLFQVATRQDYFSIHVDQSFWDNFVHFVTSISCFFLFVPYLFRAQCWLSKEILNSELSYSKPPWWSKGLSWRIETRLLQENEGFIIFRLDVQMKRYAEAPQNEEVILDDCALDQSKNYSHSFMEGKSKIDWHAHIDQALSKPLVWNQGPS